MDSVIEAMPVEAAALGTGLARTELERCKACQNVSEEKMGPYTAYAAFRNLHYRNYSSDRKSEDSLFGVPCVVHKRQNAVEAWARVPSVLGSSEESWDVRWPTLDCDSLDEGSSKMGDHAPDCVRGTGCSCYVRHEVGWVSNGN